MSESMHHPKVRLTSAFWNNYRDLVAEKILPYEWGVIDGKTDVDFPPDPAGNNSATTQTRSHAYRNLQIAAGQDREHDFDGVAFIDTDVYKWLEAAVYSLGYHPDEKLRGLVGQVIDTIAAAQGPDGYLDTFIQLKYPGRRFARLQQSHELYTMGHGIEALVAAYEMTGNAKALGVAEKMADCIGRSFGDGKGQIHGVDGHPEIELALARLGELTGRKDYLDLASWFLHERGTDPGFFDRQNKADGEENDFFLGMREMPKTYYQMAEPVTSMRHAVGHAVRMAYLLIGVAHIGRLLQDDGLLESARRLWDDIVSTKMFITGAIGSTHVGESFTAPYDLPNDVMYGETCASVAMCMLSRRMLENDPDGRYGDVMEKELFNGTISGTALDGRHFFYVNPLQADPVTSAHNPDFRHVLIHRAGWFQVACCPSNLARLIASLDRYVYTVGADGTVYADQFIASQADLGDGLGADLRTDFPWDGDLVWTVRNEGRAARRFAVRIPAWSAADYTLTVDGQRRTDAPVRGFVSCDIPAGSTVEIRLTLDMSVHVMRADNRVAHDEGKVAVMRGPVVFCAEQDDNPGDLWRYSVSPHGSDYRFSFEKDTLGGVGLLRSQALVADQDPQGGPLYVEADQVPEQKQERTITLIPYYAWANRGVGQMRVWLDRIR